MGLARFLMIAPILFTFAIAAHVAIRVLERAPHVQDSVTYLFQAQTLARGRLTAPAPPLAEAEATPHFAQEFLLVRHGRWFGKYTPGYPAVLALGVLAGAPWLVNPMLAALAVAVMFPLSKELTGHRRRQTIDHGQSDDHRRTTPDAPITDPLPTALLPPLLLALTPFFLIMSGSLMAHTAELWWTLLFMLAWARVWRGAAGHGGQRGQRHWPIMSGSLMTHPAERWGTRLFMLAWARVWRGAAGHGGQRGQQRWLILAGIAFGLLFLTRPFTAAVIGLTYGLILPFICASPLRPRSPAPLPSSSPLLLFAAASAPFLLALFAYQAAVTGDPLTDPRLLYWPYDRVGFGPGSGEPQNAFIFASTAAGPAIQWLTDSKQPPRGHSPARGLYNLGVNLDALENVLFGWPALFSLGFVWLAFLLRRPTRADWLLLMMVAGVGAGHVAYWASGVAYGPRYLFAALPALIILTARGMGALAAVAGRRPTAVILIALAAYSLITLPGRVASYRDYNFVDPGVRAAMEERFERPALVFITAGATDWWEYGAFFSGNTPWLDGPVIYARDLGLEENARLAREFPGRAVYLCVHPPRLLCNFRSLP